MSNHDYDLFVIGGGSGGVRAGRLAASMGHKVAIAEEYRYGGTCVIRGCVPKKLMVYASHFPEHFEDAAGFGWHVSEASFSWPTFIAAKDKEIARLEGLYRKGLENANAHILDTRAVLSGPNSVKLEATGETVSAERILVAVGGTPSRLQDIPGEELCITSNEVFHLEEMPASIVIFGGGYIAVEFASIFAGLGCNTTLVYRGDTILRGFDMDVRTHLQDSLSQHGVNVICGANPERFVRNDAGQIETVLDSGTVLKTDQSMLAIGRKPLTNGLGLDAAGVKQTWSGHIVVDEYSKTNVDSIWAVGDVTDRVALTPVAIHESMCFIETEFKNNPTTPDHAQIATAVFSQPEIGTVGYSEEDAIEHHGDLNVFVARFRPLKATLSGRQDKMLMKIIVCAGSDKVVGVHIMGEGAGELAQVLGIAVKAGVTKADFDRTMAVHPTASEELVTMYTPSYRVIDGKRVN